MISYFNSMHLDYKESSVNFKAYAEISLCNKAQYLLACPVDLSAHYREDQI